jgi:NhaA family Na+:H+ antiporter
MLIVATLVALIWANIPAISDQYFALWSQPVSFSIGDFNYFSHTHHSITLGTFINDFLMAVFFLSVGLEIKREIRVGELSTKEKALLPIIGACGGMIIPVVIFSIICPKDPALSRGLAIPMATDIAFSLGVLSIFKTRVPKGLKIFLAALAVADDLGGIIVIALFYSSEINMAYIVISILIIALMLFGNMFKVRAKTFYISLGLILWFTMLNSGIHATIAGVITAFAIPATLTHGTGHYLERIRENVNKFPIITIDERHNTIVLTNDQIHMLKSIESAADKMISPLQDMEDSLRNIVNFIIVPLFALANAGIALKGMDLSSLYSGVGIAVIMGLVVGKFIGVFSFSWLAIKLHIVQLPTNTNWSSFVSVCVICGIGFTVSMFIATLSYAGIDTAILDQAKLAILIGSIISALLGILLLNFTLPKSK